MYASYFGTGGRTLEVDDQSALQCAESRYQTFCFSADSLGRRDHLPAAFFLFLRLHGGPGAHPCLMIDRVRISLLPLLLVLSACMTASSSPAPVLSCRIEPLPPLTAGGPVRIRFELANSSDSSLRVLTWNTPLEGWKGTVLRVTRGSEELLYQGPMLKRGDPQAGDYAEIPAGGRVDATVDLAEVYDVSRPGIYRVEAEGDLQDVTAEASSVPRPRDRHQPVPLRCAAVTLDVAPARP